MKFLNKNVLIKIQKSILLLVKNTNMNNLSAQIFLNKNEIACLMKLKNTFVQAGFA